MRSIDFKRSKTWRRGGQEMSAISKFHVHYVTTHAWVFPSFACLGQPTFAIFYLVAGPQWGRLLLHRVFQVPNATLGHCGSRNCSALAVSSGCKDAVVLFFCLLSDDATAEMTGGALWSVICFTKHNQTTPIWKGSIITTKTCSGLSKGYSRKTYLLMIKFVATVWFKILMPGLGWIFCP